MNAIWRQLYLDLDSGLCLNSQVTYSGCAFVRTDMGLTQPPEGIPMDVIVDIDDDDNCTLSAVFPRGLAGTGLGLAEELAARCAEEGFNPDGAWANANCTDAELIADAVERLRGE